MAPAWEVATVAGYGDVVLGETTLTFNEADITYARPAFHPHGSGSGLLSHLYYR